MKKLGFGVENHQRLDTKQRITNADLRFGLGKLLAATKCAFAKRRHQFQAGQIDLGNTKRPVPGFNAFGDEGEFGAFFAVAGEVNGALKVKLDFLQVDDDIGYGLGVNLFVFSKKMQFDRRHLRARRNKAILQGR